MRAEEGPFLLGEVAEGPVRLEGGALYNAGPPGLGPGPRRPGVPLGPGQAGPRLGLAPPGPQGAPEQPQNNYGTITRTIKKPRFFNCSAPHGGFQIEVPKALPPLSKRVCQEQQKNHMFFNCSGVVLELFWGCSGTPWGPRGAAGGPLAPPGAPRGPMGAPGQDGSWPAPGTAPYGCCWPAPMASARMSYGSPKARALTSARTLAGQREEGLWLCVGAEYALKCAVSCACRGHTQTRLGRCHPTGYRLLS